MSSGADIQHSSWQEFANERNYQKFRFIFEPVNGSRCECVYFYVRVQLSSFQFVAATKDITINK